jgi:hypothetical protein
LHLKRRLGKPQSYVSKAESGERRMDFLEVRDYCRACDQDFLTFAAKLETLLCPSDQADLQHAGGAASQACPAQ